MVPSSTQQEGNTLLKQALVQIGSGGVAGFTEVSLMHPMDLIKTRFQLQVKGQSADSQYYTSIADCIRKMYRQEGIPSFWKGILPPILVETPKRATKFFTFEQYQKLFFFGASSPTAITYSLAGMCAGVTEAFLVNPFEVVKVHLQSNRQLAQESPSTFAITRQIIDKDGFGSRGLNKGLTATIARNGIFNSIYFGLYYSVKDYIPRNKNPWKEFLTKVGLGFVSGSLASVANIPFDVAKSRIQGPQTNIHYRGTINTILIVYKTEGFQALYKGLLPKVLRLGPGGAVMLVVYEYMHEYLTSIVYS